MFFKKKKCIFAKIIKFIMYNILITGANGQLGKCLKDAYHSYTLDVNGIAFFHSMDRKELDITNEENVKNVFEKIKPNIVINCAAYTNVDLAETTGYDDACKINIYAVELLSKYCKEYNCLLIHISTDYVYDGRLNFPYHTIGGCVPQNNYGKTKLYGDDKIMLSGCNYLIFRVSWLYSEYGNNFYNKMLSKFLLNEFEIVYSTIDEISCPTNAKKFAFSLLKMCEYYINGNIEENKLNKVYHYCDLGLCSRYDFAKAIQDIVSENFYSNITILPCSKEKFKTPAKRPRYSVLDVSETIKNFPFIIFNYWRDNLKKEILTKK